MGDQSRDDVGEERQAEPFEHLEDRAVAEKELKEEDQNRDRPDEPDRGYQAPREQGAAGCHGTQVRAEVDRVGDQQSGYANPDQGGGELSAQRDAKPDAGLKRDAAAELLNGRHQGKCEKRRPQHAVSKLAADLGIGPDAARIVVAGSCDEPGPE